MFFFNRKLDSFCHQENNSPVNLPVENVTQSLQDLIIYFQASPERSDHEIKQNSLIFLKNRQNMFQQEVTVFESLYKFVLLDAFVTFFRLCVVLVCFKGVTDLVIDCIDHLHQSSSAPQPGDVAGEEKKNILNCLYELLGEIYHVGSTEGSVPLLVAPPSALQTPQR